MKRFAILCLLVAAACSSGISAPNFSAPVESCTRVWILYGDDGRGSCFPVAHTPDGVTFATCSHLVQQQGLAAYRPSDGARLLGGTITFDNVEGDVALVHFVTDERPPLLELRTEPIALGEVLYCASYPHGGPLRITMGFYSGENAMSVQITGGSSGAPIMDAQGRVVGLASATAREDFSRVYWMSVLAPVGPVAAALLPASASPQPGTSR